jgi:AraC family transcriptional regulator
MSEASLLRLFRTSGAASPQKDYLRIRLNHAATLLRETTKSIEEVADACGFWDRNHFTRTFTREWKTPPAHYRRSATPV